MITEFSAIILGFCKSSDILNLFCLFFFKSFSNIPISENVFSFHLYFKQMIWKSGFIQIRNQKVTPLPKWIHKMHSFKSNFLKKSVEHFLIAKYYVRFSSLSHYMYVYQGHTMSQLVFWHEGYSHWQVLTKLAFYPGSVFKFPTYRRLFRNMSTV